MFSNYPTGPGVDIEAMAADAVVCAAWIRQEWAAANLGDLLCDTHDVTHVYRERPPE